MPANSSQPRPPTASVEIKAGAITLPIVKLFHAEVDILGPQLERRRAPDFFRNAPVIVDLSEIDTGGKPLDFPALLDLLASVDLMPVGIRGGGAALQEAAKVRKLVVLADIKAESHTPAHHPPAAHAPKDAPPVPKMPHPTKLIDHPIRSGQRIYATGSDLIVLSQVSPGAEILADGNIHVYGSMRGRALAGVQGNLEARIFCSDLQAELIAIAGHYRISENLDDSVRGRPVQVHLVDGSLIIDRL